MTPSGPDPAKLPRYRRTHGGHTMTVHAPPAGTAFDREAFEAFTAFDQVLGLDVETSVIADRGPRQFADGFTVRLVQFGTEHAAWVLDPADPAQRDAIEAALADEAHRFVTHTNYDALAVWAAFGIPLGQRLIDTHLISKLIDPNERAGHGLKELTVRHLDHGLAQAHAALLARMRAAAPPGHRAGNTWQTWGWNHLPATDAAYALYGGLDAIYVRRLLPVLLARCAQFGHLVRMEQWLAAQATGVTVRGLALDRPYTLALLADLQTEHAAADQAITDALGCPGASPRFADWLDDQTRRAGITGLDRTPTGRLQVTADTLTALAERYGAALPAEVTRLVTARLAMARTSNLIANLRSFSDAADPDGRVHPQINTLRAKTARMSITAPAMQTLKKHDPRLRRCFQADPGHVLVRCDFAQVEVRVAAALSGDPTLTRVIASGTDIHDATAALMYGDHFTPQQRDLSKRATFGTLFGGGAKALARQTGVSQDVARQVVRRWRRTYPKVIDYSAELATQAEVTTPSGRTIPADPARPYANGNYAIQSTARDLLLAALYRFLTRPGAGPGARLWLLVHDEVIVQTPESDAHRVAAALQHAMTTAFRGVPIVADAEILGTHWGKHTHPHTGPHSGAAETVPADVPAHTAATTAPDPAPANPPPVTAPEETPAMTPPAPGAEHPSTGRSANPLLDAALAYAARGWHVFPVTANAKKPPAVPDAWERRATTDPDKIRACWTHRPYNIGIATGPSNLMVIDLDLPDPGEIPPPRWALPGVGDGADALAVLAERHGQTIDFDTHTVRTGGGGIHLYYTAPPGVRLGGTTGETGNGLGWKIDTRAHGGYVLAPPSIVHDRPYTLVHGAAPAPLPAWLTVLLTVRPRTSDLDAAGRQDALQRLADAGGGNATAYADAALRGEVQRVLEAATGTRNTTLNQAARRLGRLIAAGLLPRELAEHALTAAAATTGLTPGETAATIRSGLEYGIATGTSTSTTGRNAA